MRTRTVMVRVSGLLILSMALVASGRVSAFDTYLALGDSLAFGESLQNGQTSNGDRGYVALFANALAQSNGGVRPDVLNLAVDGETSSTFLSRGTDLGRNTPIPGYPSYSLNTNYTAYPTDSQDQLLATSAQNLTASGHTIDTVTLQIGANDLLQYAYDSSGHLQLPTSTQVTQAFGTVRTNLGTILSDIKTDAPNAHVYVLGYYNVFEPLLNSADPAQQYFAQQAGPMFGQLNSLIQYEAGLAGDTYVDLATPFAGHIADDTQFFNPLTPGNVHPNAAGFEVIKNTLSPVPEPGSFVLVVVGLSGLGLMARLRARKR